MLTGNRRGWERPCIKEMQWCTKTSRAKPVLSTLYNRAYLLLFFCVGLHFFSESMLNVSRFTTQNFSTFCSYTFKAKNAKPCFRSALSCTSDAVVKSINASISNLKYILAFLVVQLLTTFFYCPAKLLLVWPIENSHLYLFWNSKTLYLFVYLQCCV